MTYILCWSLLYPGKRLFNLVLVFREIGHLAAEDSEITWLHCTYIHT